MPTIEEGKRFFVLRWRQMRYTNWPRYEIRTMDEEDDPVRWTIVAKNLSFEEADQKRKELEASDNG